jgi:hypothetical protein
MDQRIGSNWRISANPVPEESAGSMAGKLKIYQTSLGFFDLAIAAPLMNAVPETRRARAWAALLFCTHLNT